MIKTLPHASRGWWAVAGNGAGTNIYYQDPVEIVYLDDEEFEVE